MFSLPKSCLPIWSLIAGGIASIVVLAIFMLLLDWQIGLIMVLTLPLGFGVMLMFRKTFLAITHAKANEQAEAAARLLEYVQGIKLIRSFGLTAEKFKKLNRSLINLKTLAIRLEIVGGMAVIGLGLVLEAGFLVALIAGTMTFMSADLSLPMLIAMLVLAQRFYAPILDLTAFIAEANYIRRNMDRIDTILDAEPLNEAEDNRPDLGGIEPTVTFDKVGFRYSEQDDLALRDISFELPKGSMTALVGPSGSGKSTLSSLIVRFHEVGAGEIRIGGIPIAELSSHDLHKLVAMVFQDIYLFRDTVAANLKMAKPDATEAELHQAAKAAQAHDFIMAMPDGYDTIIGEGGANLSGGEKQRIAIASALLKDAPILLLDEATASIDAENEAAIQKAIRALVRGRTTLVVAHRLASIVNADRILVLDHGVLVEQGSHDELLAKGGLYARMWDANGMQ